MIGEDRQLEALKTEVPNQDKRENEATTPPAPERRLDEHMHMGLALFRPPSHTHSQEQRLFVATATRHFAGLPDQVHAQSGLICQN